MFKVASVVTMISLPLIMCIGCIRQPATLSPQEPDISSSLDVSVLAEGLDTPWAIDFAPDGRIFITERPGRIRIVQEGRLQTQPWFTLEAVESGESGLLGLVLDPQFDRNGFVYAAYTYRTADGHLQNRLIRLRDAQADGKGVVDKILLDGIMGAANHDGGRVKFGADAKLYWTTGDAQRSELAQDLSSLNGKILRLNPDGTIPTDNPFPGSPVYSYGHRNPQGLAWQPDTGRLYATEHGPSGLPGGRDELNYIEPGNNYGWPIITGEETRSGMISPVIQSGTSETWAPGGATFVTQGDWSGSLLFVGLRGQSLYRVTLDGADPRKVLTFEQLFTGRFGRLRDVAQSPDGAIYILTSNRDGRGQPSAGDDKILRIVFSTVSPSPIDISIASCGHTSTHRPQPRQASLLTARLSTREMASTKHTP
jgi:glucose/arabinose dehydrogenase